MQYEVRNKIQSWKLIESLGLNTLPYILQEQFDEIKMREFLEKSKKSYMCDLFGLRSLIKTGSELASVFDLNSDEVLEHAKKLSHFVVHGYNEVLHSKRILCGEAMIEEPYYMQMSATVSTDPKATARSALYNPTTKFNGSILHDKKIKHMVRRTPGLEDIIEYIQDNDLIGVATEFAICSEPVGRKKENIVVFELRTDF